MTAPRTPTTTMPIADALLGLDRKFTAMTLNRDTNWPLRIAELHAELARNDPDPQRRHLDHQTSSGRAMSS